MNLHGPSTRKTNRALREPLAHQQRNVSLVIQREGPQAYKMDRADYQPGLSKLEELRVWPGKNIASYARAFRSRPERPLGSKRLKKAGEAHASPDQCFKLPLASVCKLNRCLSSVICGNRDCVYHRNVCPGCTADRPLLNRRPPSCRFGDWRCTFLGCRSRCRLPCRRCFLSRLLHARLRWDRSLSRSFRFRCRLLCHSLLYYGVFRCGLLYDRFTLLVCGRLRDRDIAFDVHPVTCFAN